MASDVAGTVIKGKNEWLFSYAQQLNNDLVPYSVARKSRVWTINYRGGNL